jgi:hypothetical protein
VAALGLQGDGMSQDAEDRMRGWLDRAATRMSEIGALLSEDVAPASSDSPSLPPPPGSASGALLPLLPAAVAAGAASSGSGTVSPPVGDISPQGGAAAPGTLLGAALNAAPATATHAAQQQPAEGGESRSMAELPWTATGALHQGSIPQMLQSATVPAGSGASGGSVTSPPATDDSSEAAAQQEQGGSAAGNAWLPSPPPLQTRPHAPAAATDQPAEPTAIQTPAIQIPAEPAGGASPAASVGSAPSPSPQRSMTPPMSGAPDSAPSAAAGSAGLAAQTSLGRRETASDATSVPAAAPLLPAGSPEAAHSDATPPAALPSPMRQPSQGLIELLDGFNGSSAAKAPVPPLGSAAGGWADGGAPPQQHSVPPPAAALRARAAVQSDGSEAGEEVDSSDALLQQVGEQQLDQC